MTNIIEARRTGADLCADCGKPFKFGQYHYVGVQVNLTHPDDEDKAVRHDGCICNRCKKQFVDLVMSTKYGAP